MKEKIKQAISNWGVYGAFGLWLLYEYSQQDKITQQFSSLSIVIIYGYYLLYKQIEASKKYSCIFTKDIIPEKEEDSLFGVQAQLSREISLPFPPYEGMSVSDYNFHPDNIESVYWQGSSQQFICKCSPIQMTKENILGDVILRGVEVYGWQINEGDLDAKEALEASRKKRDEEWKKKQDAEELEKAN